MGRGAWGTGRGTEGRILGARARTLVLVTSVQTASPHVKTTRARRVRPATCDLQPVTYSRIPSYDDKVMCSGIRTTIVGCAVLVLLATGCRAGGGGLVKQYEYEEEIYLGLDGSATVYVNASIPALVSLRGLTLDTKPNARLDRELVRSLFSTPVTNVVRVSTWRRFGRRFVQVRMTVNDIRTLSAAAPFSWATYGLASRDGQIVYRQQLAASAGGVPGNVGWTGNELIAVRLHLPARIRYHNAGADNLKRGNILVWEQSLAARRAGTPLMIEARMDSESILYSTLLLFAVSGALALGVLAILIWWVGRTGKRA
jgi:hypothetical protein